MNRKRFRASFRACNCSLRAAHVNFFGAAGPPSAELPRSFRVLPPVMFFTYVKALSANRLGHPAVDPFDLRNSCTFTKLMPAIHNEIRIRPCRFTELCAPEDSHGGLHRGIAQYVSQTRTKHSKAIFPPSGTLGPKRYD